MALSLCGAVSTDRQGRELAEHGTALFPVACYYDDLIQEAVPWHWHEELEVMVVEVGSAQVSVNGADYLVQPGEGFFINAGALHSAHAKGDGACRLRSVVFHPRLVGGSVDSILWQKYLEPLLSNSCCPCLPLTDEEEWESTATVAIQEAWQAEVSEGEGFEFAVREHLSRLILLLAQNCPREEKRPSEKALRDGARIKTMLQYIQKHISEELTLAKIAASAAVSENECLRCFRGMLNCSPIQYVKQLRIQRAAELLITTDQKIADIGAVCGFQEMSYFAKTFQKLKGCTPSEFRWRGVSRTSPIDK